MASRCTTIQIQAEVSAIRLNKSLQAAVSVTAEAIIIHLPRRAGHIHRPVQVQAHLAVEVRAPPQAAVEVAAERVVQAGEIKS